MFCIADMKSFQSKASIHLDKRGMSDVSSTHTQKFLWWRYCKWYVCLLKSDHIEQVLLIFSRDRTKALPWTGRYECSSQTHVCLCCSDHRKVAAAIAELPPSASHQQDHSREPVQVPRQAAHHTTVWLLQHTLQKLQVSTDLLLCLLVYNV